MAFKQRKETNDKSKTSKSKATGQKDTGGKWINYRFSKEDKTAAKNWAQSAPDLMSLLFEESAKGYKFSLGSDQKNDSFIATFTDKRSESPFCDYSLSQRGRDAESALAALLFVHTVALADGWVEQTENDYLF